MGTFENRSELQIPITLCVAAVSPGGILPMPVNLSKASFATPINHSKNHCLVILPNYFGNIYVEKTKL